jgi:hypothetical protein
MPGGHHTRYVPLPPGRRIRVVTGVQVDVVLRQSGDAT